MKDDGKQAKTILRERITLRNRKAAENREAYEKASTKELKTLCWEAYQREIAISEELTNILLNLGEYYYII